MNAPTHKNRVVVAGGGFGGVYTAAALEKATASAQDTDITLISRDNYLLAAVQKQLRVFMGQWLWAQVGAG